METLGGYWRDILQRKDDNLQELICNNFHQGNHFCRDVCPAMRFEARPQCFVLRKTCEDSKIHQFLPKLGGFAIGRP